MYARLGDNYVFIETVPMSTARKELGWEMDRLPAYVKCMYRGKEEQEECAHLILEADAVLWGSAPERLLRQRIRLGKLILRYSERPLKGGVEPLKYIPRMIKWHLKDPIGKPIYMLCAGAYTAGDYALFGLFKRKTYTWGYFPEVRHYADIDGLLAAKQPASILWAARFLDLKHPEIPVQIAKRLKQEGYSFTLNLIGIGALQESIRQMISENDLADRVHILGAMPPDRVRAYMEHSEIFLFTSDRREGWGAVLNESMNSGCAVVASHVIGSVPFLLQHGENGLIYKDGDFEDASANVKFLLDHPKQAHAYGRRAYFAMTEQWNAENAAERLLLLSEALLRGEKYPDLFVSGPCSRAECIKESWFVQ